MQRYVGALDQGTTSTRFLIFDRQGAVVALAQREHAQHCPGPGLVEHDADEIWAQVGAVVDDALAEAGLRGDDLAAIGVANQRETVVVWDRRTGAPLHRAIVWMDARTQAAVAALRAAGGRDLLRAATGLPLATYFSALKLAWLLDHVPGARTLAEAGDALFGTVDSWLAWRLTGGPRGGVHVTDVTNASRTQLMDLRTLDWDARCLELFRVPRACLPAIRSSSETYGVCAGPLAGAPLGGLLGDQQAALLGQACLRVGDVKATFGTGGFLLMNTGDRPVASTSGLLTTLAYRFGTAPAAYALEGSIAIAGALVQWLRDELGFIRISSEIEMLAACVRDNGGVVLVPAFSGLYAPLWNEGARGAILGLTRFANRAHIARAALEAVAFQTRDVLDAMEKDAGARPTALRVDGGMAANASLMQLMADVCDVAIERPASVEATAAGAAFAAGLAVGFWRDVEEIGALRRVDRIWRPAMTASDRDRALALWRKAVSRCLDWTEA